VYVSLIKRAEFFKEAAIEISISGLLGLKPLHQKTLKSVVVDFFSLQQ
jgi:hypothetical protein